MTKDNSNACRVGKPRIDATLSDDEAAIFKQAQAIAGGLTKRGLIVKLTSEYVKLNSNTP
jgi:hypothetical protein